MRKSVRKDFVKMANKNSEKLYQVSAPCIDDNHFKEEELKTVGELSKVCSHIVLTCLYLTRIGSPDIRWSVSKPARCTERTPANQTVCGTTLLR